MLTMGAIVMVLAAVTNSTTSVTIRDRPDGTVKSVVAPVFFRLILGTVANNEEDTGIVGNPLEPPIIN